MESDGDELDYDFDTPQKPRHGSESRLGASADKNQAQPRAGEVAAAKANANDEKRPRKDDTDHQEEDVEEELYGDIVSPGGAGAGGGGGAALLTLQVAEVRLREGVTEEKEKVKVIRLPRSRKLFPTST